MIYRKKKQGDLTTRQLLLSGNKVVSYTDSEQGDFTLLFIHGFPFNKDFGNLSFLFSLQFAEW